MTNIDEMRFGLMQGWARAELACIKVNLPPGYPEFAAGNGEGVWVLVDKETEALHDQDGEGLAQGFLANWPITYPRLQWGDAIQVELRGPRRAVARPDSLQGPCEPPEGQAPDRFLEHEAPQLWPDASPADRPEPVRDHWLQRFGPACDAWYFDAAGKLPGVPTFKVLEFHPRADLWCYATDGMSRQEMTDGRTSGRAELCATSREQSEAIVYRLANLATFPFAQGAFLDWGHTVSDEAGEVVLAMQPDGEQSIALGSGAAARVIRVVRLFPKEQEFRKQMGTEALLQALRDAGSDLLDWERQPALLP